MDNPWEQDAACTTTDPDAFFTIDDTATYRNLTAARRVCAGCPVRNPCAELGLQFPRDGIFGGLTPGERRRIRENTQPQDGNRMSAYQLHTFDWPRPPLSMNDRFHRMKEAKLTSEMRKAAAEAFASFGAVARVEVTMTWQVKDRRRRDDENPVATLKALCDGLVDAGVVPDDTREFMVKHMPVIDYQPGEPACIRLEVREIP